jgi:hypothetical protein
MRELFNKALTENLSSAKYAVNEIQKQVFKSFHWTLFYNNFNFKLNMKISCNAAVTLDQANTQVTYRLHVARMSLAAIKHSMIFIGVILF